MGDNTEGIPELLSRTDDLQKLIEALQLLVNLLEKYAPSWYTEEHQELATGALSLWR